MFGGGIWHSKKDKYCWQDLLVCQCAATRGSTLAVSSLSGFAMSDALLCDSQTGEIDPEGTSCWWRGLALRKIAVVMWPASVPVFVCI